MVQKMGKLVQDCLPVIQNHFKCDVGETQFVGEQLLALEARMYRRLVRPIKFRRLFNINNSINRGAQQVAYNVWTRVGIFKVISDTGDDTPKIDAFVERKFARVRTIGGHFSWSMEDIENAIFAQVPLQDEKMQAAITGAEFEHNKISIEGETDFDLQGMLTNPNISNTQVAQAAGGTNSRVWGVDKTAVEVVEDIADLGTGIIVDSNEVHTGNVLTTPIDKLRFLNTTSLSTLDPDKTIRKHIMNPDNGFGLTQIESVKELTGSGTGSTDQMVIYDNDPMVSEYFIPMEFETMPPQIINLMFKVIARAKTAGLIIRYPTGYAKGYGI